MYNFKVGDFVKYIHSNTPKPLKINNINCSRYYFEDTSISCLDYELIPWTPEPGEWCWSKGSMVKAFIFKWTTSHYYDSTKYEPFLGELPYNLKDL